MIKDRLSPAQIQGFQKKLLKWYKYHHRKLPWRETSDPYHTWISEVMLQQTQVATVVGYFKKFIQEFPDVQSLAAADMQDVLKSWEGMGYYARARHLYQAAKVIVSEYGGKIPSDYATFRRLPGVGEYIAAAVGSIAFHRLYPVVDGNVKRVLARLFCIDLPVNQSPSGKVFKEIAENLLDRRTPGRFNQALMELGATVCRPMNPLCHTCPVPSFCQAFQSVQQSRYPRRIKKKTIPQYHIAVGVVRKDGKILITRRRFKGLLGGLWEFPGGKVRQGETAERACVREIREEVNLDVAIDVHLAHIKHAYTHFKIEMDVFWCRYLTGAVRLKGPVDYRWIALNELDDYPFPGANLKFLPLLKKRFNASSFG